ALHGRRVDDRPARVVGYVEATPVIPGNAVIEVFAAPAVIDPHRQLCIREAQVSRGGPEKENLLTSGMNDGCQEREDLPKPGATGKDIGVSRQVFTGCHGDSCQAIAGDRSWSCLRLSVLAAFF